MSNVISEITKVVNQDKVTKVDLLIAPAPTVKFYHVTVDTPKGSELVKVTVDSNTNQVTVIDQAPLTPTLTTPTETQGPSSTTIVVDQVTGVKTTTSTDSTLIRNDKYVKTVHETIVK